MTADQPLTHHNREKFAQLLAGGMSRTNAYIDCSGTKSRGNASRGAGIWYRRPEVSARLAYLMAEKASEMPQPSGDMPQPSGALLPDLDTSAGRFAALKMLASRGLQGGEKTSDSIAALRELIRLGHDLERSHALESATCPSQIMAALSRVQQGESITDQSIGAGFSLSDMASRIGNLCGLDGIALTLGTERGKWSRTPSHDARADHLNAGHTDDTDPSTCCPGQAVDWHTDQEVGIPNRLSGANFDFVNCPKSGDASNGICPTLGSSPSVGLSEFLNG